MQMLMEDPLADMTGTLPTDFKLTPQPAEKDLDQMDDPVR